MAMHLASSKLSSSSSQSSSLPSSPGSILNFNFPFPGPTCIKSINSTPRSRPCSLEEQYFKCGIFWDYDAPQRRVSNSEAPVLAGGIHVFLRGSQFSGASELKEELESTNWHKFLNVKSARRSWLPPRSLGTNAQCMERKGGNNIFAKHAISLCKHKQD